MNIETFFKLYDVRFWTSGKNVSPGWVNICCPFCGDKSNHGGFNLSSGQYNCWRCGTEHKRVEVLKYISNLDVLPKIEFDGDSSGDTVSKTHNKIPSAVMPGIPLMAPHKKYLLNRGVDPTITKELYGIRATNHLPTNLQWRIVIPIFNKDKKYISYQARDITGKQKSKYIFEKGIEHRDYLYNEHNVNPNKPVIVVEGIFDTWSVRDNCVATFGIKFTQKQILLLSKYKRLKIIYDNEPEAQKQARKLYREISVFGCDVQIIPLPEQYHDPGEMEYLQLRELLQGKKG